MSEKLKAIQADMLAAMKAGDKARKGVLSMVVSRVKLTAKNDKNREPTDADVLGAIPKMIKEGGDTREGLVRAGRDTAEIDFEIAVLTEYLPTQMTDAELEAKIEAILGDAERSKKALGMVMKTLNADHKGEFDPKTANVILGRLLT